MSYVYVVKAENMSVYKIGIAIAADARLKTLQAGSPVRLLLLKSVHFENGKEVESRLHEIFACSRVHNEWFDLGNAELDLLLLYLDDPDAGEKEVLRRKILQLILDGKGMNEIVKSIYGVTGGRIYTKASREVMFVIRRLAQDSSRNNDDDTSRRQILDSLSAGESMASVILEVYGAKSGRKFSEGAAEVNKVMQYLAMQTIGGNNG